jgi:protein phosphatase
MKFSITAVSNVGCVRENNEDMVLVDTKYVRNDKYWTMADMASSERFLIALADGMGGHNRGEVASSDTLHNLQFFFNDLPSGLSSGDFNEMMIEWLNSINNIIDSKGRSEPQYHDMGTTLVCLAYYEKEFYWMNCGDSRLYHFRDGFLKQLTTDHSLNNLNGIAKHSSIITNCIGGGCKSSFMDIVKCSELLEPGDVLLLCSDGLTDMVNDSIIQNLLAQGADASRLCDTAIAAGGFDNVSICVIKIV